MHVVFMQSLATCLVISLLAQLKCRQLLAPHLFFLTLSPLDYGVINCLSAELINLIARGSPFGDIHGERVNVYRAIYFFY